MNKIIKKVVATAVFSLFCFNSSATIIFSDDFDRANNDTVGNGWSTVEDDNSDVAISDNALQIRDYDLEWNWSSFSVDHIDSEASQNTSTESYKDIFIDFDWAASYSTESSDSLFLSWTNNGTDWTNIWSTSLGGSGFTSVNVGAIAGADDLSNFGFKFSTNVDKSSEAAYIDNVVLSGTQIPEPMSLALLGLALAGIGFSRKQKNLHNCDECYGSH
jgi:hypothetical protein